MTPQFARENLAGYLAGGLSNEEREEIQELLKSEAELAAALEELRGVDDRLRTLFVSAKPPLTLEDNVIQRLRRAETNGVRGGRRWPFGLAIGGVAALVVVVFGTMGVSNSRRQTESQITEVSGGTNFFFGNESTGYEGKYFGVLKTHGEERLATLSREGPFGYDLWLHGSTHHGANFSVGDELKGKLSHERSLYQNNAFSGLTPAGTLTPEVTSQAPTNEKEAGGKFERSVKKAFGDSNGKGLGHGALGGGALGGALGGIGGGGAAAGPALKGAEPSREEPETPPLPSAVMPAMPVAPPALQMPGVTTAPRTDVPFPAAPSPGLIAPSDSSFKPGDVELRSSDERSKAQEKAKEALESNKTQLDRFSNKNNSDEFLDDLQVEADKGEKAPDKNKDSKDAGASKTLSPPNEKSYNKKPGPTAPTQRRVIIRSGEIVFEVESFDNAATVVTKLVGQTKGGVVATTNSDKLPNGKTRGSIVVRMPPEELDEFVMALRRDLGKTSELKLQRIGSQDVTKQYTDLESELRGLRVSEERLISMLKDVKATLKDLLAVETQLATTRTKIERIEGELRYYSNLAAMSTLTIELFEKEIRVAAGVVESERVQAGIEADDVDKAFQSAKAAIDELKGRVFRSELKQAAAGQVNAILEFDVAPESAGLMRDRLKQLGVLARLDIDRVQKVEGGGAAIRESKIKRGDAQFLVSIYNLANMAPRETVNLTIVGNDVPASYRKLRELVAKVGGNLRHTAMANSDTRNVSADLVFDVRRADEPAVQTALADAGEFLTRRVERAAEDHNVTDAKVRFIVRLSSVGGITAREKNVMSLAALDVPESYRKLRDSVVKAKGYMRDAKLQESDPLNITGTLDFDVMRADEAAILKAIAEAGETLSRNVQRWPEGNTVTDAKVGFTVTLQAVASIPARESVDLTIAAVDVPAAFAKLREALAEAKANVVEADLSENDRLNISASLVFNVLRSSNKAIRTELDALGEQLQGGGKAVSANGTDAKVAYKVKLVAAKMILPRHYYAVALKVDNVEEKLQVFQAAVADANGWKVTGPLTTQKPSGKTESTVTYRMPLAAAAKLFEQFKKSGQLIGQNERPEPKAPEGKLAVGEIVVDLRDEEWIVPGGDGFGAQVRSGVSYSLRWLSATASFLIAALLFVGPWAMIAWVIYRVIRWSLRTTPEGTK